MNKFLRTISSTVLIFSLVMLSACFNDSDTDNESDLPEIKNPDVGIDVGEQGYPDAAIKFYFRAAPKITEIKLDWDSVAGAASYDVSRKLQGGTEVLENTIESQFSFTTGEKETYEVWVAALDTNGDVLEVSSKMNVTTGSSASLLISDEGI